MAALSAVGLPRTLMWTRVDLLGSEIVFLDDRSGLIARGTQIAVDPVPYRLAYELRTDAAWQTTSLTARAEGSGWTRTLDLARDAHGWRADGTSSGAPDLAAATGEGLRSPAPPGIGDADALADARDVDLGGSPLTNTLPVRRLGLREQPRTVEIVTAWVLPPTLEVVPSRTRYDLGADGRLRYRAEESFDIALDDDGWVVDYPGLALRVNPPSGRLPSAQGPGVA